MNVSQLLQFVDRLVVERTGKHLDDVQRAVVEGTWQRETYDDIAQKCHVSKNHVGDVGAELWQLLSEILGENIKKTNFRSTFERLKLTSSQFINIQSSHSSHNFSFCSFPERDNKKHQASHNPLKYHDLTVAPQIINFYAREPELKTLYNWIFARNTRLISVLGLSGIGKTTLVKRFVDIYLEQFEVIIWRSLKNPKSLELLVNDLLKVCNKQQIPENLDEKLKQLLDILMYKKSLIILDHVEKIFIDGQLAGEYRSEYQDYQNFFSAIAEVEHQSNVILISQEQCAEMESLDGEYPIKYLDLSGLDDVEILKGTGLKNEESWYNLLNLYEGNPAYLKSIAISIKKIFDGDVAEFLAENSLIITKNKQCNFNQLFNRLSPIEQQLVLELSKFDQPVSREYLKQSLDLSSMNLINGLQSLQQRYLVTKIKEDKILFKLSSVFQQYLKNCCLNLI